MNQLSCNLFIIVFILVTTYLLGHILVHVFSEKIKETKPHSLVVHLHPKKGKNKYFIKGPISSSNSHHHHHHNDKVEGFVGDHKCPNCPSFLGKNPIKQVIKPPKSKGNKAKVNNPSKTSKKVKNKTNKKINSNSKTKSKNNSKTKSKDKVPKEIETFTSGDKYLKKYRKMYKKCQKNSDHINNTELSFNAYNTSSYL